jgi:hypothetical protein
MKIRIVINIEAGFSIKRSTSYYEYFQSLLLIQLKISRLAFQLERCLNQRSSYARACRRAHDQRSCSKQERCSHTQAREQPPSSSKPSDPSNKSPPSAQFFHFYSYICSTKSYHQILSLTKLVSFATRLPN